MCRRHDVAELVADMQRSMQHYKIQELEAWKNPLRASNKSLTSFLKHRKRHNQWLILLSLVSSEPLYRDIKQLVQASLLEPEG